MNTADIMQSVDDRVLEETRVHMDEPRTNTRSDLDDDSGSHSEDEDEMSIGMIGPDHCEGSSSESLGDEDEPSNSDPDDDEENGKGNSPQPSNRGVPATTTMDGSSRKRRYEEAELQQPGKPAPWKKMSLSIRDGRGSTLDTAMGSGPGLSIRPQSPASTVQESRPPKKHWPKIQGSEAFEQATVGQQRQQLTDYMQDLLEYSELIQAGAVPIGFVSKFFKRLDTHFHLIEAKLDQVEVLHRREAARKFQISKLWAEGSSDHDDTQSMLSEFDLPSCRSR